MVASLPRPLRLSVPVDSEALVNSVQDVMRAVTHELHPVLEAEGLSKGEYWALHLVASLEAASVSSVARHLLLSAPTVCVSVDRLEAKGLLTRHRSARDRRAVDLTISAKGRRTEARVWNRVNEIVSRGSAGLPPEDLAAATRVFRQLARNLLPETATVPEAA